MFGQLFRFEAFYQLKQRAFPLFAALFTFFGYIAGSNGFAPANVNFNSSYQVNNYLGLFSLGSVFIIMFFAISGTLRDSRYKMDNIIFSTSVQKLHFFWSRFVGVFLFSLLAFSPFIIGIIMGQSFSPLDPERLAPFDLVVYLQPWLIVALPNIFICSTIIFSVSLLTRSNIATYVSAVFIYMLYMVCSIFLNSPLMAQSVPASPEAMAIAALADPFSISAFFEQTQFWTPFEKNTQLLSFSGLFMWNRIIWLSISFLILFITYQKFSFRKIHQKVKKGTRKNDSIQKVSTYRPIAPKTDSQASRISLLSLLKIELSGIAKSLPFIAIMVIWIVITISEIYSRIFQGGQYSDHLYPLTNLIIINILDPLKLLGIILIVFYSGELVWRERSLNFSGIIDATPVRNWTFFLSKFLSLLLLPASLIGIGIVIGMSFQIATGFFDIEIAQYLSMFYFNGMQLFLFSVLAVFVQSIVRNKYLGMGITGLLILSTFLSARIGIEHPMLRYGFLPNVGYTNMAGYSGESLQFFHLSIYWIGLAGILTLVSFKLWQRGICTNLRFQIKAMLSNWKKWEITGLVAFLILFASSGSLVFYNMNVVNDYTTASENLDYQEQYERKFKQYESIPQLYPLDIKTVVDLYPDQNRYVIKADYIVINRDKEPIKQFLVTARTPIKSIEFENAPLINHDSKFDTYLFEFQKDISQNETVNLKYEIDYHVEGYAFDREILKNGTYISHRSFEPYKGYRSAIEISDNFERDKRGLPKREEEEITDEHLKLDDIKLGRVNYETIISTSEDEIAIASGRLVKEWNKNGRNYYHYKTDHKIVPTMGYFSSDYEVRKKVHNGISIEQYYYPDHHYNIDSIASSTMQTLDYCTANFGAYSTDYIRIAEIPGHWPFGGFAHPDVISLVEDRLYLTDIRNPEGFNLVAKRTIHEVAHQWWGHILVPKLVDGGAILVEGLAKYTEAVIMEKLYGKRAIFQLSETANRRYFSGRAWSSEPEPPLYLESGQDYLAYGKNYNTMIALRDLVGEKKLNKVLRSIADRYRGDVEFSATSLELLDELYKVSPDENHVLIDDWFKRVITYDLSVADVSYRELDNGKFELTVIVNAKRFETQKNGEATPIDINEPIQIGLFEKHPSLMGKGGGTIYLQPHQISEHGQEIKVIVDELPNFVSIDPYGTRVEENMYDNVKML